MSKRKRISDKELAFYENSIGGMIRVLSRLNILAERASHEELDWIEESIEAVQSIRLMHIDRMNQEKAKAKAKSDPTTDEVQEMSELFDVGGSHRS